MSSVESAEQSSRDFSRTTSHEFFNKVKEIEWLAPSELRAQSCPWFSLD